MPLPPAEYVTPMIAAAAGTVAGWWGRRRSVRRLRSEAGNLRQHLSWLETALAQSQLQFRTVFENAPAGIIRADTSGCIFDCNAAFLALTGSDTVEQVVGTTLASYCACSLSRKRLDALLASPSEHPVAEIQLSRKDGSMRWVLVGFHNLPASEPASFQAILVDLTERKNVEQELERSRMMLQNRLFDLQRAYWVLEKLATGRDLDEILQWLTLDIEATNNDFRASVLRLQPGEPPALAHAVAPNLPAEYIQLIEGLSIGRDVGSCGAAAYHNRPVLVDDIAHHPNWAPFLHLIQPFGLAACWSLPIRNWDGAVVGTLAVYSIRSRPLQDEELARLEAAAHAAGVAIEMDRRLRRERELSAQLQHAQKMEAIGRLAGGIAHDFNNLLTVILGHTQLLASMELPPESTASLDEIRTASDRAAILIRELLTYSRRQATHASPVELNGLVEKMRQMLQRVIGEHIELDTQLSPGPAWLRADPIQLEQILMNLVLNARDAMPEGGRISISTQVARDLRAPQNSTSAQESDGSLYLRIRDTGHGMDAETVAHIFEPFFTTKNPGQGTGLGLATVYAAVQQNHGQIHVHSQPGEGAEFVLRFPRIKPHQPPPAAEAGPAGSLLHGQETILLVEDEPAVRSLIVELLENLGYQVLSAGEGAEALEVVARYGGEIQLLITDVVMPGMSGPELAEQLKARRPQTRVLMISGYPEVRGTCLSQAQNLLPKPFSQAVLAQRVRETLEAPRPTNF